MHLVYARSSDLFQINLQTDIVAVHLGYPYTLYQDYNTQYMPYRNLLTLSDIKRLSCYRSDGPLIGYWYSA